jgi:GxxExxY protein
MLATMMSLENELNELSSKVIKAAINVHRELGPGLLEAVYQQCLLIELAEMGLSVQAEVPVPVRYRKRVVSEDGFRIDLLVEHKLIVELKSVEEVKPVHLKQLLTYLRLTGKPLGLLINFNVSLLKDGIERVINVPRSAVAADSASHNQP